MESPRNYFGTQCVYIYIYIYIYVYKYIFCRLERSSTGGRVWTTPSRFVALRVRCRWWSFRHVVRTFHIGVTFIAVHYSRVCVRVELFAAGAMEVYQARIFCICIEIHVYISCLIAYILFIPASLHLYVYVCM